MVLVEQVVNSGQVIFAKASGNLEKRLSDVRFRKYQKMLFRESD